MRKKNNAVIDGRREELMKELKMARDEMDAAYINFSYVVEPDMVDCCIYQINALQLKYKIILNQMKDLPI